MIKKTREPNVWRAFQGARLSRLSGKTALYLLAANVFLSTAAHIEIGAVV